MSTEARLRTIAQLATSLADQWATYAETEAHLAIPVMAAAGGGHGRSTDVPDPTSHIALSHDRYWETDCESIEALGHLRAMQRTMDNIRRHHSSIANTVDSAIRAARCSGEIDPLCVNNAVRDTGDNAGLCWKCIKRKQRDTTTND